MSWRQVVHDWALRLVKATEEPSPADAPLNFCNSEPAKAEEMDTSERDFRHAVEFFFQRKPPVGLDVVGAVSPRKLPSWAEREGLSRWTRANQTQALRLLEDYGLFHRHGTTAGNYSPIEDLLSRLQGRPYFEFIPDESSTPVCALEVSFSLAHVKDWVVELDRVFIWGKHRPVRMNLLTGALHLLEEPDAVVEIERDTRWGDRCKLCYVIRWKKKTLKKQ